MGGSEEGGQKVCRNNASVLGERGTNFHSGEEEKRERERVCRKMERTKNDAGEKPRDFLGKAKVYV